MLMRSAVTVAFELCVGACVGGYMCGWCVHPRVRVRAGRYELGPIKVQIKKAIHKPPPLFRARVPKWSRLGS